MGVFYLFKIVQVVPNRLILFSLMLPFYNLFEETASGGAL